MEKYKPGTIRRKPDTQLSDGVYEGVRNIVHRVPDLATPGTEIIDDMGIVDDQDFKMEREQSDRKIENVNPGTHLPDEDILVDERYTNSK